MPETRTLEKNPFSVEFIFEIISEDKLEGARENAYRCQVIF